MNDAWTIANEAFFDYKSSSWMCESAGIVTKQRAFEIATKLYDWIGCFFFFLLLFSRFVRQHQHLFHEIMRNKSARQRLIGSTLFFYSFSHDGILISSSADANTLRPATCEDPSTSDSSKNICFV